jgi:hypothetical protein
MTNRIKIAPEYDAKWLEVERPQTLSDTRIESMIETLLPHKWGYDVTNGIYTQFKSEMQAWLFKSQLNSLSGFDQFNRVDIINGCTQFIDTVYMKGPVQIIKGDYRYHARLNPDIVYSVPGYLRPGLPLIIAAPFPSTGDLHVNMKEILDECLELAIPVHIDGAWITCSRDIVLDVGHSAIRSIGISLSKGLGLGWNRIGLRWTRDTNADAVTVMNDFNMNLRAATMIGLHFIQQLPPDYLWTTHGDRYRQICRDFDLEETRSIYLALRDGHPVGVAPLIRYLENADGLLGE